MASLKIKLNGTTLRIEATGFAPLKSLVFREDSFGVVGAMIIGLNGSVVLTAVLPQNILSSRKFKVLSPLLSLIQWEDPAVNTSSVGDIVSFGASGQTDDGSIVSVNVTVAIQ